MSIPARPATGGTYKRKKPGALAAAPDNTSPEAKPAAADSKIAAKTRGSKE